MGIVGTIDINVTIISEFTIVHGGIIWNDTVVSGSDFWYSHTLNPAIFVIMDRKPSWDFISSNRDIIRGRTDKKLTSTLIIQTF